MTQDELIRLAVTAGKIRQAAGIRQVTVAAALGLTSQEISTWEAGRRPIPPTPRGLRYRRFALALRRAWLNQQVARAIGWENGWYVTPPPDDDHGSGIWLGPPEDPGAVGGDRRAG